MTKPADVLAAAETCNILVSNDKMVLLLAVLLWLSLVFGKRGRTESSMSHQDRTEIETRNACLLRRTRTPTRFRVGATEVTGS